MDGLFGMLRGIGGKAAGGDGAGALLPTVPAGRNFYAQIEPPAGNTAVIAANFLYEMLCALPRVAEAAAKNRK